MLTKEYFSHDYGTRNKPLMAALLYEQKARGYGLFWIIVEMLHEGSEKWLSLDELSFIAIGKESGEPVEYIQEFIDKCINRYKVFILEENRFTTERVLRNISKRLEISAEKSEAGKRGAAARWQKIAPAIHVPSEEMAPAINEDSTAMAAASDPMANDGKVKESKVKESKSYLRPKGLTAAFAADPVEIKALKAEYDALVLSLDGRDDKEAWASVKLFVSERKPSFIEPYIDLWNMFALSNRIIKEPIRVTEKRRKKFATRILEQGFDFIAILTAIKGSAFLKGQNDREWRVSFAFIIDSEENYTNILEGKYK